MLLLMLVVFGVCAHARCVSVHLPTQRACDDCNPQLLHRQRVHQPHRLLLRERRGKCAGQPAGRTPIRMSRVTLVQLMATGGLLAERGFKFWDFGMEMPYVTPNIYTGFVYQMTFPPQLQSCPRCLLHSPPAVPFASRPRAQMRRRCHLTTAAVGARGPIHRACAGATRVRTAAGARVCVCCGREGGDPGVASEGGGSREDSGSDGED